MNIRIHRQRIVFKNFREKKRAEGAFELMSFFCPRFSAEKCRAENNSRHPQNDQVPAWGHSARRRDHTGGGRQVGPQVGPQVGRQLSEAAGHGRQVVKMRWNYKALLVL
jgi:hypothetical protein